MHEGRVHRLGQADGGLECTASGIRISVCAHYVHIMLVGGCCRCYVPHLHYVFMSYLICVIAAQTCARPHARGLLICTAAVVPGTDTSTTG